MRQGLPSRHRNLANHGRHSPKDSLKNCRFSRRQLPFSLQCDHWATYAQPAASCDLHIPEEVRGDQVAARECYLAFLRSEGQNQIMTIEERKILVKSSEELDTIELEDGHPKKTTKIGANLPPKMKESFVRFLKNNKDVFAWSHEDMLGINPSIISHKLNVNPSLRPVK